MLKPSYDDIISGRVALVAAFFFLLYGLFYPRISKQVLSSRVSKKAESIGVAVMRPALFFAAAMSLIMAYFFFT